MKERNPHFVMWLPSGLIVYVHFSGHENYFLGAITSGDPNGRPIHFADLNKDDRMAIRKELRERSKDAKKSIEAAFKELAENNQQE